MIILDSNVWIAFLNKDDNQHKKAEKIFQELTEQIFLPEYVIIEVCSILLFKAGKKITNHFIDIILSNENVEILLSNNAFFNNILNKFKHTLNKNLSFIDFALLYLSKTYQVITFDKNLQKAIKS